jgi:phenylpyruvate tautomerase PptA (4-oxalocrotonate tautomerase family)
VPMIDLYVPEGALTPEAEEKLVERLTGILVRAEGFEETNEAMRSATVTWLHRAPRQFVAGKPADAPRYKVVTTVPEGQLNSESRAWAVAQVTEAVLDAEEGRWPRNTRRVWVFSPEIPEGQWGSGGVLNPLASILTRVYEPQEARELANKRIAHSRAERLLLPERADGYGVGP